LQNKLGPYRQTPPNGLAVFCGNCVQTNGKEKKVTIAFEPFKPLSHSLYKCGAQFHTEMLRDQLSDSDTWGFIIIDGQGASFHTLTGRDSKTLYKWDNVSLPKKHGRGGQSKQRFERIREQKRGWFTSEVASMALYHFIDPATTLPYVVGLIVAGCADLKQELVECLDQRLAKIVACVVDVQYGGHAGFQQAVKQTEDKLSELKYIREQKAVSKLFEYIAKNGRYSIGIQDTMFALESGTVETLLLWDQLPHVRSELVSRVTSKKRIVYHLPDEMITENGSEWDLTSSMPLIDWILDHYHEFGASIDIVSDQSSVGSQFANGFGGIASFLRFDIPLPSQSDEIEEGDTHEEVVDDESDVEYTW